MKSKYLSNVECLQVECQQAQEEGKDTNGWQEQIEAIMALSPAEQEAPAGTLLDKLVQTPVRADFPYIEPSDLEAIRAARPQEPMGQSEKRSEGQIADKILGAWLGRCAGCLLGKPVEGVGLSSEGRARLCGFLKATGAYPLADYFNFQYPDELLAQFGLGANHKSFNAASLGKMPEDDDLNYTTLGLHILKTYGLAFTPAQVAEAWLTQLPILHTFTAERVAYRNFVNLINPPESAVYRNPYREWIGAQIRADIWGYVAPGKPELAAELAWRDASISHTKNGLYGAMFVAAMLAAAFTTSDIEAIVQAGLAQIPAQSRLAEAIRDVVAGWHQDNGDWEAAIDRIYAKHGKYHPVHTINNAALVTVALLYGGLDFGKTIGIAVMGGWDTDCNGATAGSIVGLILGAMGLPAKWVEPLNDTLETGVQGYMLTKISDLAKATLEFAQKA